MRQGTDREMKVVVLAYTACVGLLGAMLGWMRRPVMHKGPGGRNAGNKTVATKEGGIMETGESDNAGASLWRIVDTRTGAWMGQLGCRLKRDALELVWRLNVSLAREGSEQRVCVQQMTKVREE